MPILDFQTFSQQICHIYSPAECRVLWNAYQDHKKNDNSIISDEDYIENLKKGKPYQQILGMADFFGLTFFVNPHTLIPRPETEELLEVSIAKIKENFHSKQGENIKILEIGTGSGVIPIILKKNFPKSQIKSLDISKEAIEVAKKNAEKHKVEIAFLQTDFLNWDTDEKHDIIISNPPYIGQEEAIDMMPNVLDYEPHLALFSPVQDPLIFYKKIAEYAQKNLNNGGLIFLEINQKYGKETLSLFENFSHKELLKDLSKNDRIIWVNK